MKSTSHKIASGIFWNTLQLIFSKAFTYLVILGLAKELNPQAFGLIGMATVFTGLSIAIVNASITAALIQLRGNQLSQGHYDSSRTFVLGLNVIIWFLYLLIIGPFAAWFYDEPGLRPIISILALQAVIGAFNVVPRAKLSRELDFKRLAYAESSGAIVAGIVALGLAASGFGIWSLVAQSLLLEAFQIPLLRHFSKDKGQFSWTTGSIRKIRRFVAYDGLNRGLVFFTKNIDYLLVGKLLGSQALGVYTFAFMATDLLRAQIMNLLNRVMFPVYGQLQDDPTEVKNYYLKVVRYNTLAIGPIMLMFLLFSSTWVPILLGSDWKEAVFPMQAMAVGTLIHAFGGTTDTVLKAMGKVDLVFKIYLWKTICVTLPAFILGIHFFGIRGAAIAIIFHKLVGRIFYQHYMGKYLAVSYRDLAHAAIPVCVGLATGLLTNVLLRQAFTTDKVLSLMLYTLTVFTISTGASLMIVRRELVNWYKQRRNMTDRVIL